LHFQARGAERTKTPTKPPETTGNYDWSAPEELPPSFAAFHHSLRRDGFTIIDGALRRTLPVSLKLPEAENEIIRLLNKHGFAVAKGHLDQAFTAHTNGSLGICQFANP